MSSSSNYSARKSATLDEANLLPEVDEDLMRKKLTEYQRVSTAEIDSALDNFKEVCSQLEASYDNQVEAKAKKLFALVKHHKHSEVKKDWDEVSISEQDFMRRQVETIEAGLVEMGVDFDEYIDKQFT